MREAHTGLCWPPQDNRALDLSPVRAVTTVMICAQVIADRGTGPWPRIRERMLQLPGGLFLAIARVGHAPRMGVLFAILTPADNPEHAVPFRLWESCRAILTMLEPGTPGDNRRQLREWEVARVRHGRRRVLPVSEPRRVHAIGGVIADGVLVQDGDRLQRAAFVVERAGRPQHAGMVRPSACAVLRLMISSNFIGCCTGKSAGLVPFKIRSI